jgi:SAM-dependent methyltransferase
MNPPEVENVSLEGGSTGLDRVDDKSTSARSANLRDVEHQPLKEAEMSTAEQGFEPAAMDPDADRQLKAKHRALWASGDYPAVSAELIPTLGPALVRACGVRAGDRVLDVAAGSDNAAIAATAASAIVTASDLTPELFDAGRRIAAEREVEVGWVEADAEALPFADNGFDVVMSCVGAMFAPHHQATADELLRVCRPGGTIGMINRTPEGFIGKLFATMKPYAPPAHRADRRRSPNSQGHCEVEAALCTAGASAHGAGDRSEVMTAWSN